MLTLTEKPTDAPTSAPTSAVDTTELVYLKPDTLTFAAYGDGLRLTVGDEVCHLQVSVVRVFPLSDRTHYLSVRLPDNKEVGILRDLDTMNGEGRQLVEAELARRYLTPLVQRILRAKERFGTVDWEVETDRGPCRFTTRNLRENVVQPSPNRYLLTDVDSNRYDVRDVNDLDATSQSLLLRYV